MPWARWGAETGGEANGTVSVQKSSHPSLEPVFEPEVEPTHGGRGTVNGDAILLKFIANERNSSVCPQYTKQIARLGPDGQR